ncbi:helix-turn-helix transcriptional regulator [Virgibacillus salexigens]|uniref:helix-turn-helix transcriptional regulator n=1 Tax=Virgibacillus TaxID=84406 RepID=UPI00136D0B8A|nr:helix-turn-helix transcriptional regulator [Virgibacillus massiliensis]MYL41787.1 helix-turn-helix domain-containing protein [Virgibacillus massiliensis]
MHWELVKLRKSRKITQIEMAELLGVDVRTYSLKENGKHDFKLEEIFIIAKFFGKRIEEIFLPRNIRNTDIL